MSPNDVRMIDVGEKAVTHRTAIAKAKIHMEEATLRAIRAGKIEKGNVLEVARIAAISAAKETSRILPLCHPIALDHVGVHIELDEPHRCAIVTVETKAHAKTGVEMEALTAATAAALCIYDMCKSIDRWMTIEKVELIEKRGGKSGTWVRDL